MEIQLGYYPVVILLVLARTLAFMAAPFFGQQLAPQIRVAMALMITFTLLPTLSPAWVNAAREIQTMPGIVLAILNEVLLGAAIVLICNLFIGACSLAGELAGQASSLMMAQSIDPFSGSSSQILEQILQVLFILLVLLSGGHLVLLRMLGASFQIVPPAFTWLNSEFSNTILSLGANLFVMGLQLAMPLVGAGLVISVCFGLIGRLAPDFDVMFMSFPVHLAVGLSLFGLVLRFGGETFSRMIDQMLRHCARVLM
jgi:flagellar biosynthetic protein FliR